MSEALGNAGAEGKTLNFTEADRSRVFGSNRGGVGFSGLQHYSLPHQEANTVWGFGNKTTAEKKVKQNDPEKNLFTTFVGSPNQHKSNTVVLQDAVKEFQDAVKAGKVHPEQINLMNKRLKAATDEDSGALLFGKDFDLRDPDVLSEANSFNRRAAIGDVMLGTGVKGEMRRRAFKDEHGAVPFDDAGKMESILKRETDPDLVNANTYDVGNRLFVMDNGIIHRPDLNVAFPYQVTGEDLGMKYQLVPPDKAMRDFYKMREGRLNKNGDPSPVSHYDLSRAQPSQMVDEDYLTFLQKEGHKDGGAIDMDAADARLEAAINKHMAKGGSVDIEAADARLAHAMAQRMAGGGGAFKKIAFMAEGGGAFKTLQFKAEGGSAFKTLQFREPQHFDGGGIASPEEVNPFEGASRDPILSRKDWENIKRNAPGDIANAAQKAKQHLKKEASQLGTLGGVKDFALRTGAQYLGGIPDLVNLGLVGVDAVADTNLSSDKPWFGSDQYIDAMSKAGVLGENEFPVAEALAGILAPAGLIKKGVKRISKGFSQPEMFTPKPLAGSLPTTEPKTLDTKSLASQPSSVKLQVPPEAKTASTGKPQGAIYATKQDGPFYRVSPTDHDLSGAKSRGLREADELQGQAPVASGAGEAGSQVPLRISDEEVARLVSNPETNQPLQIAKRFTKDTQGTDFTAPDIPESSLAKQSAIGRAHQLAVEGSPEYKTSVFDAYAREMPDVLEQSGAKNYDDLMEKAYRQLAKETDEQFKQLPYNFSYHRAGEGDYLGGSKDMMADVHGNKHLYVFQGGDPHDFLNRMDKASGLNENEKFRAVHDLMGHAIYGNQFGPKGEEAAWAIHQQMYSPLARLAMTAETRGQNSLVNYSPLNVKLKTNIAKLEDLEVEAMRRKDTALVNEIRAAKRQEFASNFQFAPQKAVLLPPEFLDPKFAGGLPDYLSAANRPAKGTETQSVLTHFSNDPNLQMLDPKRYGTGIKGAEAERLRDFAGGVKDRSYVYLGEPGTVSPESGLGVNRYRGESQNLYDITKDPLAFRALARESNRTPFTAKYNQGITHPLQEANDYERLVKEYGYEGMINPNSSKPMGIMFQPTPVQPRARGGLTQLRAR
jgi:hypothetical protein